MAKRPNKPLAHPDSGADAQVSSQSDPASDPAEVARYVGALSAELAVLARSAKLDLLAYFLDMARMEASTAMKAEKRRERDEG